MAIFKQILQPRLAGPRETELPANAGDRAGALARLRGALQLALVVGVSATLDFWDLSRNHWANTYYSAAVRSMSTSWHNFLYASLDPSGVMTVDKPPLAFWVQALSVRIFGYEPLSILIPEALMGVATVVLVYDLVRRMFGDLAGVVAALALATTPITVAMSRDNNPDALVALLCVAALWFLVRAIEDGRTRWIVLSGAMVGLAFETKMGVALVVVPGIVVAWLWLRPRGVRAALDQLIAGGFVMIVTGGAWPLVVGLTPAPDRPWISGTADNSIVSLIFGYNGFGRVSGQIGGPAGPLGSNGVFGGAPGPLRLLDSALGGQAGWLVGLALVGAVALAISTRLRRSDPRSAWIVAVGLTFVTTAVLFSVSQGIFHPYYVSLLAPFTAALVGASIGELTGGRLRQPLVAALLLALAVVCELVVLEDYGGQLSWAVPLLLIVGVAACLLLLGVADPRVRLAATLITGAALLVAPAIWSIDTLGHAVQPTFPAGGPVADNEALASFAVPPGAGGPAAHRRFLAGAPGPGAQAPAHGIGAARPAGPPARRGLARGAGSHGFGISHAASVEDRALRPVVAFVRRHGGGPIAVSSQSHAADAIIEQNADVAGLGGWSGLESRPTVAWFASEVTSGAIRWVYSEGRGNFSVTSDGRRGDSAVLAAVARACTPVELSDGRRLQPGSFDVAELDDRRMLFDCAGRGAALVGA
jgi:4-amino-4-deoxy-L-arabinose transferase-like glycosyltransferase